MKERRRAKAPSRKLFSRAYHPYVESAAAPNRPEQGNATNSRARRTSDVEVISITRSRVAFTSCPPGSLGHPYKPALQIATSRNITPGRTGSWNGDLAGLER